MNRTNLSCVASPKVAKQTVKLDVYGTAMLTLLKLTKGSFTQAKIFVKMSARATVVLIALATLSNRV
jgi:hypothetical protein